MKNILTKIKDKCYVD